MKIIRIISMYFVLLCLVPKIEANPRPITFFSELKCDSLEWIIEMINESAPYIGTIINLDSSYLESSTTKAYFKNNMVLIGSGPFIITQDSLQDTLYINPKGDYISFHCPRFHYFYIHELVRFGDIAGSDIAAPTEQQSICEFYDSRTFEIRYYLDNTPTLGRYNDTTNATGMIAGKVINTVNEPLENVTICNRPLRQPCLSRSAR